MNLDVLDDPNRINWPLRRKGERGSNEWERCLLYTSRCV